MVITLSERDLVLLNRVMQLLLLAESVPSARSLPRDGGGRQGGRSRRAVRCTQREGPLTGPYDQLTSRVDPIRLCSQPASPACQQYEHILDRLITVSSFKESLKPRIEHHDLPGRMLQYWLPSLAKRNLPRSGEHLSSIFSPQPLDYQARERTEVLPLVT